MIFIASDRASEPVKAALLERLPDQNGAKIPQEIVDLGSGDVFELACTMARRIEEDPQIHRGIFVDSYGALPFMVASKFPRIICAECNDEHSAKMTRDHNNANMIAFGTRLIGLDVAASICRRFLNGRYSGGRHQIRIDMLERMCHEPVEEIK